jgi:hypothetical protein
VGAAVGGEMELVEAFGRGRGSPGGGVRPSPASSPGPPERPVAPMTRSPSAGPRGPARLVARDTDILGGYCGGEVRRNDCILVTVYPFRRHLRNIQLTTCLLHGMKRKDGEPEPCL